MRRTSPFALLFLLAAGGLLAFAAPPLVLGLIAAAALCGAATLVHDFLIAASLGWLLVIGATPEFWLGDLMGGGSLIIAAEKLAGLLLAGVCILRYGGRFDAFNPGLVFAAIFAAGLQHGLHPRLEALESARSLAGSAAPFAFSFSRLSREWGAYVVRLVCWLPLLLVFAGTVLWLIGLHPLFVNQLGFRLQATGIPAFLGGIATTGAYACFLELFRTGRAGALGLLVVNLIVLVLSGARAPLAVSLVVMGVATLCLPARRFGALVRLPLVLGAAASAPLLVLAASQFSGVRLFNMLSSKAESMSGRELLWPPFQQAWSESPLFGWGLGAAKAVLPEDSVIARLTGTTAPHNEYLRIGVEGGYLGLGLLILFLVLWTVRHTAALAATDRVIMRLVMIGVAAHAAIDNLLISTTSGVLFAWVSAVFARGAWERAEACAEARAEAGGAASNLGIAEPGALSA